MVPFLNADKLEAAWAYLSQLAVQQGMNALAAMLILVGGWWLSGYVAGWVFRGLSRTHVDETVRPLIDNTAQWVVRVLTVVLVLAQFGVQTASIIAMLGAAGLAIGLALQGTLQNIAAGIMLVLLRPFRVGQYIDAQGVAGTVRATGLFMTELTTADGVCLRVPNGKIWGSAITNYSENPTRRIDVQVVVPFDTDVHCALQVMRDIMHGDRRVLKDPPVEVAAIGYVDAGIKLNARCWTMADDMWVVQCMLYATIKPKLDAIGCKIAAPAAAGEAAPAAWPATAAAPAEPVEEEPTSRIIKPDEVTAQPARRLAQVPRGA